MLHRSVIAKRFHGGLTDSEQEELQHLQELADRQLEKLDALMLKHVTHLEAPSHRILDVAE